MGRKDELLCQTCANNVNGVYCTLSLYRKDLTPSSKSREYKKCVGYKEYVAPPPKVEVKRVEKALDYEALGEEGKFLKGGGHYSARTGKYNQFN